MTDRLKGCTVTFDDDFRDDDAEAILGAIRLIRGVADVRPVLSEGVDDWMARVRVRREVAKEVDALLTRLLER